MDFKSIAFKMFKSNFRKYILFLLCCSYSISVFFIFSTIYTNKGFMQNLQLISISSNIIAPSIVVAIFSVFFIIYSYNSFIKYRKREFGLFMSLGMTDYEITKIIIFEMTLIAILAILFGLVIGTFFSPIFNFLVLKIVSVKGLHLNLSFESYIYSILFFLIVFILVLIWSVITCKSYKIVDLLKQTHIKDNNLLSNPVCCIVGLLSIAFSFLDIICNYRNGNSTVFLRSFIISFIGVYLCLSNISLFLYVPLKFSQKLKYKYMLFFSNLKHSLGQTKKILFVMSLLAFITILFTTMGLIIMSQSQRIATLYNPYDIAYAKLDNINNISDRTLNNIIKSGQDKLTLKKEFELIISANNIYLSDNDANEISNYKFHVKKGHFISLFQIVQDDGYTHDLQKFSYLNVPVEENKYYTLLYQSEKVKVIFNRLNFIGDSNIFILNAKDYLKVKFGSTPKIVGNIKLFNFQNWMDSDKVNCKLNAALEQYNKENLKIDNRDFEGAKFEYQTASKIGDYNKQMQSSSFLIFLCIFMSILFFVSSEIMLHFKLLNDFETEKIKYKKINNIGIQEKEISETVSLELMVVFIMPIILSILLGVFYCSSLLGNHVNGACYSIIVGLIYLVVQILYYFIYKKLYIRKLINSL